MINTQIIPCLAQTENPICIESEETDKNLDTGFIITCTYKNIKIVSACQGFSSSYGDCSSTLYIIQNGSYVEASNSEIFNSNQEQLVVLINERLNDFYNHALSEGEDSLCFRNMKFKTGYTMDEFYIDFADNDIRFEVPFFYSKECLLPEWPCAVFDLSEIDPYLK